MRYYTLVATFLLLCISQSIWAKCDKQTNFDKKSVPKLFLSYIKNRDSQAIGCLANNRSIFDPITMQFLVGDSDYKFPVRKDLRTAYSILSEGSVVTKVVMHENGDGSEDMDVVYLPEKTAGSFDELSRMIKSGKAEPFLNYVVCRFHWNDDMVSMPHVCYAETDVVE